MRSAFRVPCSAFAFGEFTVYQSIEVRTMEPQRVAAQPQRGTRNPERGTNP
jgi:hypothetical protein